MIVYRWSSMLRVPRQVLDEMAPGVSYTYWHRSSRWLNQSCTSCLWMACVLSFRKGVPNVIKIKIVTNIIQLIQSLSGWVILCSSAKGTKIATKRIVYKVLETLVWTSGQEKQIIVFSLINELIFIRAQCYFNLLAIFCRIGSFLFHFNMFRWS